MTKVILALLLLLAISVSAPAWAEQRYVSDQLVITLRQGQGEKYKIIKTLKTGTAMDVLGENGDYLRVRTQDGTEGYVLKQYVTDETPKSMVIARLERVNSDLKNRLEGLQGQHEVLNKGLADESKGREAAETALANLKKELQATQAKYEDLKKKSANVVQISTERDQLKQENVQLSGKVESLSRKNDKLIYNGAIRWFLAGGGILFFGWVLGRVSRNKRKRGFA